MAVSQEQILQAIADGCSTTEELANRFGITQVAAAMALSRATQKGILLKHKGESKGGRPHLVYRFSGNGHQKITEELQKEIDQLKARIKELEERSG